MAYNFKSIADVEVVAEPAESANVLIEENGVIKKTPKTAVGGAGGGGVEPDMVITLTGEVNSDMNESQLSITHGNALAIQTKLSAHERPIVKMRHIQNVYGDYNHCRNEYDVAVITYGEGYWFAAIVANTTGPSFYKVAGGFNADNLFTWASCTEL